MDHWNNINVNANLIESETAKAVLFNMPKNSSYKGFAFWLPKKCVRPGRHSAAVSIGFTDDWEFNLTRRGERSLKVLEDKTIDAEEFMAVFEKMNDSIVSKKH